MPRLRAQRLYKVFGARAAEAVQRLQDGQSREEVRKKLGVSLAVLDATFDVQDGETFVVMGLSGSGKSTIIRMLNGLLTPTSGRVFLDQIELTALDHHELRRLRQQTISMVFQHFALFPHRTVLENAGYALEVRKVAPHERREKARNALRQVGLDGWDDSLPAQLSGGMRQRVGLARALAAETDILLMDEAFSALDPLIRREMQDQLLELQRKLSKTIVFITHDLNEAMRIGDRVAMLRDGRIVQIGTAQEIINEPADDYVAEFVQDVDRTRVLTAGSVQESPSLTATPESDPAEILRWMRRQEQTAVFVVGSQQEFYGAVTEEDLADAVSRSEPSLSAITQNDVVRVLPGTVLADLVASAARSRLPLAVVEQGRLLGVVSRSRLLEALSTVPPRSPANPLQ